MTNKITITPEIKAEILKQYYDTDVEVKALAAKHGISRQTIYNWTKGMRRKSKPISIRITQSNKALWAARNHSAFEARVNSILRNANVSPNACLRDKLEEMARLHAEDKTAYPIKSLCAAMQVSRGAFYGYTRYGKHGHAWFDIHIAEIEKAVETVFNEMEQRDAILGIELMDGDVQVSQMEEIIAAHPHLRIIIGHFGMVTRPNWMSQIQLARHENVFVESGGITWLFNDEFYPFPSAVRAIKEAADAVGIEKLMWGSDYPRTITAITYKMSYDFVTKSKELTDNEKKLFLSENAKRFFGFGELKELPYIKNMSE